MATRISATVDKTAWTNNRALQLARQPGKHSHPTATGFFIRVSPLGKAVFGYKFRDAFGAEQAATLGTVAAVSQGTALSLDDALTAYAKVKTYHLEKSTPGTLTVQRAFDAWIVDHRKNKGGGMPAAATLFTNRSNYERYLKPVVGDWMLSKTSTEQWRDVLLKVQSKSPNQARIAYWMLCSIYKHFIQLEALESNPVSKPMLRVLFSSKELLDVVRKTNVSAIDLAAFVQGVMALKFGASRDALMVMLLTSWRKFGVLRMRWAQIDWEARTYTVLPQEPGWKGYHGPMALSDYVLGYLEDRRKAGGETISPYVFPARHGRSEHLADMRGSLKNACAGMGYEVTSHDVRRTFATIADIVLNGNMRLIGLLMAHAQPGTAADGEGVRASATTAKYLVRNLAGESESGRQVAEAMLEIADVLPLSEETAALFKKRGIDITQRKPLALVELEDDDDGEDGGGEAAVALS